MHRRFGAAIVERWSLPASGLIAIVLGWVATGPKWLTRINWDNGVYLAQCTTGALDWSLPPWNAHFAIGHVYYLGYRIASWFGGTCVDGFRTPTTLAFAISAIALAGAAFTLTKKNSIALLVALLWMSSWAIVFLLLTLEDNLLHLAPTSVLIWLCVSRFDRWNWQMAAVSGSLCALAALLSWQALPYLWLPCAIPLFQSNDFRQQLRITARQALLVVGTFLLTAAVYCAAIAAISDLTFVNLGRSLFAKPTGNFSLVSPWEVPRALHAIGAAGYFLFTHTAYDIPAQRFNLKLYGAVVMLMLALLAIWSGRSHGDKRPFFLAITLLIFTWVVPIYKDVTYRYLVRFDFLPALSLLILARNLHKYSSALKYTLALTLLCVQISLAVLWQRQTLASYATNIDWSARPHPSSAFYGRDGRSWFGYFRELKKAHPNAKQFVFEKGELSEGQWNFDVIGSLASELPEPIALASTASQNQWRFPVKTLHLAEACRLQPPPPETYLSTDAQRWLIKHCPLPAQQK